MKKVLHHPVVRVILSILILIGSLALLKTWITKPLFLALFAEESHAMLATALSSCGILVVVYRLLLRYYWGRPAGAEFQIRSFVFQGLGGVLLGFGVLAIVLWVLAGFGYFEITGQNSWMDFLPGATVILGGVVLEEMVFRGMIFYQLERWKGTTVAVMVSAILFQLPHFGNPGEHVLPALGGFLFGVAHAYMYASTRQLWLPIGFHFGWNITMPFFGITLSGIDGFGTLFTSIKEGPEWLTGSAFGLEDSVLAFVMLIAVSWVCARRIRDRIPQGGLTAYN